LKAPHNVGWDWTKESGKGWPGVLFENTLLLRLPSPCQGLEPCKGQWATSSDNLQTGRKQSGEHPRSQGQRGLEEGNHLSLSFRVTLEAFALQQGTFESFSSKGVPLAAAAGLEVHFRVWYKYLYKGWSIFGLGAQRASGVAVFLVSLPLSIARFAVWITARSTVAS
jgi:hypothetical protein